MAGAQSESDADADGAASDDVGMQLVGLQVVGENVDATPDPDTENLVPGVGC